MANDGSQLEALVAFVEETLLPQGFEVETNQRIFNDDGIQIAEFDVEVRGKVGTTSIAWLIECRDRPGTGPAPGSWIEQLVGRRTRFGFNKVTAVSTTGFAVGAVEFARKEGIELREVASLTPEAFSSWLMMQNMHQSIQRSTLESARVILNPNTPQSEKDAVSSVLSESVGDSEILRSIKTGQSTTFSNAFVAVAQSHNVFDEIVPNSKPRSVRINAKYTNEDHYVIDTENGPVPVEAILFSGTLTITEILVPISTASEYRELETGEMFSQVAAFEMQEVQGVRLSLELHRLAETGKTHVVIRKANGDD